MAAVNAGNTDCTTGMSGKIFTNWKSNPTLCPSGVINEDAEPGVKALIYVFAKGIADQINEDLGL